MYKLNLTKQGSYYKDAPLEHVVYNGKELNQLIINGKIVYKKTPTICNHASIEYVPLFDGSHDLNCTQCGVTIKANEPCSNYTYASNGNGTHTKYCRDCGYEYEEACFVDSEEILPESSNQHTIIKSCLCGAILDVTTDNCSNDGSGICSICGQTITTEPEACEHDYVYEWVSDSMVEGSKEHTHIKRCKACGDSIEETVEYTYIPNNDGTLTHRKYCPDCGRSVNEDCTGLDGGPCPYCGFSIQN